MSNIKQLENFINQHRTYEEVKQKAFDIDKNWRSETWTRGLRGNKLIQALKNKKGHIIAYEPINTSKTPPQPISSPTSNPVKQDRLFNMRVNNY